MRHICSVYFILITLWSCKEQQNEKRVGFEYIDPIVSKVDFVNQITESDTLNYYTFPYLYMGGGVAIGDVNNDGLSDIFFTGNMTSNRLYLNKGDFQFEDISRSAGVLGDDRWYTGVTMVDINNDGWLDIYLSVSGIYKNTANQLLINNGDNTFTDRAEKYGLADSSCSIQATFFDYDKDGHLDVFIANYAQVEVSMGNRYYHQLMKSNTMEHSGHLYHNEKDGTFKNVTAEAGLQNFGMTLGIVSSDFNNDGWIDLYLSNDFNVPDYLYINNGDGTFKESLKKSTQHTAMFGMGTDAADLNNDGFIDFVQLDMTPSDHKRSKTNMASMSPNTFYEGIQLGFHYQYMQNAVQLNNGTNEVGRPIFSDVSRIAGIATTDWSWGVVCADLDNDGLKDMFISNGILRDVNNNDVLQSFEEASFFQTVNDYSKLPSTPVSNYLFKNEGDLSFSQRTADWGVDHKGFSNGISYSDLNNDGKLDLVVNNVNEPAYIYKNINSDKNKYLKVKLEGPANNILGIGAKLSLTVGSNKQYVDQFPTRGFQSSVDPMLFFGLGRSEIIDELSIEWPDGKAQNLSNLKVNQILTLSYNKAKSEPIKSNTTSKFQKAKFQLDFSHKEDVYDDFRNEPLLPHKNSNIGPAMAIGDVNNDGLDDIFIGNAKGSPAQLFIQGINNDFKKSEGPWELDSISEDTGVLLHDFDHDGDLDLYVASGGNNPDLPQQLYHDRLYMNVNNTFKKSAIPDLAVSGKVVLPFDFDDDGDIDIFVGGRIDPGNYPNAPQSFILENKGGRDASLGFSILDAKKTGELANIGLVTSALWVDLDNDGNEEIVVTGEWMNIEVFSFNGDGFVSHTSKHGLDDMVGWWYSMYSADIDNDGDQDIIAGNLGLNYKYKTSEEAPFSIYASDFDENGRTDIVLSYEKGEKRLPLRGRQCSSEQVPAIAVRFKTYDAFANASLEDIYGDNMLESALHYQADRFDHVWLENDNGTFRVHSLPALTQISSINSIEQFDFNKDQFPDFLLGGNLYESEVETPRNDASIGLVLIGREDGFKIVKPNESGLMVQGEIRDIKRFKVGNTENFIFLKNNSHLEVLRLNK